MNESARSKPANRSREFRQQQRGQSVGAVDVKPGIDFAGDIGAAGEIVDDSGVCRTGRGDDDADIGAATDRAAQRIARQPAVGSGRHHQRLEAEDVQGVVDRGMRGVGDGDQSSARRHARDRPPTPTGCRSSRRS